MDINLDNIALEVYGKLETRFTDVKIGSESGEVLSKKEDIPKARFFEFPYKEAGKVLGTITITLDDDDGVVVQVGGDLVDSDVPGVFKFIRSMGRFANKRTLDFKIINLEKSNLDKRDYEFQAKRKEETVMPPVTPVMESKFYGTAKISYQDLGEARLIVKHSQPVNTELAAGRTMHIESIYIENADGERFKYPYKHLNGARALAEHLKHGGNPYDPIGKHITGLSEEMAQLRKFKGYVSRNQALAEAMGDIHSKVMERIEQIKEQVQKLQRKAYYESFAESFEESAAQEIPEAIMDDWIDRLTVRTFNEDLKTAFPYIFKLVDESEIPVKELSPEDILSELSKDTLKSYAQKGAYDAAGHIHKAGLDTGVSIGKNEPVDYDHPSQQKAHKRLKGVHTAIHKMSSKKESMAEDQFEAFINSIVENEEEQTGTDTLFSPNKEVQQAAIEKLNKLLASDLKGGNNEINAKLSLKGIIDDPEFIQSLDQVDPDLDIRVLIQKYVQERDPSVAMQLTFGEGETGGQEPEAAPPAPVAPPPPAPVAPEAPPAPEAGAVPPAPEAGAVPPEAQPGAMPPPAVEPPPSPVAEGTGEMSPFSRIKARLIQAKECGAQLDTKLDFGHRTMTLQDAIEECGLTPMECGFNMPEEEEEVSNESGMDQILKMISGFWNKEAKNFTIGGTRAKQKVVKGFKDGEFPNATEEDVKAVLRKIEELDPSSSEHEGILKLAGVPTIEVDFIGNTPNTSMAQTGSADNSQDGALARLIQLSKGR
jgi:hypothetical protein